MCQGKQVEILYEPVAVRHLFVFLLLECRNSRTSHWGFPRRWEKCAESKYPLIKAFAFIVASANPEGNKILGEYIMKMTSLKKTLSFIVCIVLITAMALVTIGCDDSKTYNTAVVSDGAVLGEGAVEFPLEIVDGEGKSVNVTVKTDKTTVGEALLDLNLIAGDVEQYGLYIKCVNGITAIYEENGKYWAFYIDGEYAMSGVDTTNIVEGAKYSLKVEG